MTGSKKQCINWLLESEAEIFDVKVHKEQRNPPGGFLLELY